MRLTAAQDRIIVVLRKLLDVARQAQTDVLAEMNKRPGGDLPDDAKQKLEELRKKLDKFLGQQKKIIEASENLAKTPVEDFTAKEEELLKTHGRRRGRLGEVHEGSAFRFEQAARAGFCQPLDGQGTGRNPDRTQDGGRRAD